MMRFMVSSMAVFGLLVLFGSVVSADLNEGLILNYNFDEVAGAEVIDTSGNGNTGEIVAGAGLTAGKFGQGLSVDGVTQFVLTPHSASMDATAGVTMACWIMPDTPAVSCWLYYMISKWNYHAGDGRCYFIGLLDGAGITFFLSADGTDAVMARIDGGTLEYGVDKWQHIAGTYDGSNLRIYIDGEEVGILEWSEQLFVNEEGMSIGAGSLGKETAAMFTGIVDEVAVYNRGLSGDEIRQLMGAPLATAVEPDEKLATTWGDIKFIR